MKILIVVFLIVPMISARKVMAPEDETSKIISGQPARRGQFPWQASISSLADDLFCGGSLITTKWVLTAAHCVEGIRKFKVRLGTLKSKLPYEKESIVITTNRAIIHKDYDRKELLNDIAVVDLQKRVKLSAYVKTIPLGTETIRTGVSVTVSGWGQTSDAGNISPILNFANLTTITNSQCQKYYDFIPNTILCCGGGSYRSICDGDSGGPLVKYDKKGNAVLVGIVSFSAKAACANGYPSGYTRIKSFYGWILSSIK